jgi:hypothetical protein
MSNRIDANQIQAELDRAILSQSKKVARALKTLTANRRHQQDKLTLGWERVERYVEDVEGDWLDDWT